MKKTLILIDFQKDYFKGGKMELVGIDEASQNAFLLLKKFRQYQLEILHVQHINRDGNFLKSNTQGVMFCDLLSPKNAEKVIKKEYPNSFKNSNLLDLLQKRSLDHLVFCGAMSHMCIDSSVRAAYDLGFTCTLIHDACATKDLIFDGDVVKAKDVHFSFMSALSRFAEVVSTEEFLKI